MRRYLEDLWKIDIGTLHDIGVALNHMPFTAMDVAKQFGEVAIARGKECASNFYAFSVERRTSQPAIVEITKTAWICLK